MKIRTFIFSSAAAMLTLAIAPAAHAVQTDIALNHEDIDMLVAFNGENSSDIAGSSSASAGDVNGDGFDDIIIGAVRNDEGGGNAGAAYLIYGQADEHASASLSTAVKFTGETIGGEAGVSVASAGDVNNDGFDDILIGAYEGADDGSGAAYLIYGQAEPLESASLSTAIRFTGEAFGDGAGYSVASAGDVNGDEYDDILIGAWKNDEEASQAGAAYLIYGQSEPLESAALVTAGVRFTGVAAFDFAGTSVASAGDVNNDGFDDILIGASQPVTSDGLVYLIYGQEATFVSGSLSSEIVFTPENLSDTLGYSVDSAGDVNADGYDDILIGANNVDAGAGAAYLLYGQSTPFASSSLSIAVQFTGEGEAHFAGDPISAAGDINGDGYDDLLVGANNNNELVNGGGAVYVIYGKAATYSSASLSSAPIQLNGMVENGYTGWPLADAGDVNNDGYDDILIGALDETAEGRTYLLYSQGGEIALTGAHPVTVECASSYSDAGATASDPYLGTAVDVTTNTSDVDTDAVGDYSVVYTASSILGAVSSSTRTVEVVDTTAPSLSLNGAATVTIEEGELYTDAGATATDSCEGTITGDIIATSTVHTAVPGSYTVTYTVTDASGNDAAAVQRTVVVEAADDIDNDLDSGDGDGTGDTVDTLGAVESIKRLSNNRVQVTYENGTKKIFKLFAVGSAKAKVQLHSNGQLLIAINKQFIRTYNAFTGERVDSKKLFKKKQYKTKFKRYNVYKSDTTDNVIVLAQANQQQKKQFKIRAYEVKGNGSISVRNSDTITTVRDTAFAKLNTVKNKKSGSKARIIVTRDSKKTDQQYKVLKKTGRIVQF